MARKGSGQTTQRGEGETRARPSPRANLCADSSPRAPSRAGRAGRPARKSSRTSDDFRAVCVQLTPQQVGGVLREARASETITMPELLAGLVAREEIPPFPHWEARYRKDVRGGQFSLSTLKAMLVLAHLADGEQLGIIDLATRLQMGSSAIHRYLGTLQILGLVEQDPKTRKYWLAG
jgi:DNA-binding MarR family transcriptional regulator